MKKLITTLILLLMFSSPSYAKWTKVVTDVGGNTFYLDFERIRKVDGFVYWWQLTDFLKPNQYGHFSGKSYRQGDCKSFRWKILSWSLHKEPMGGGTGYTPPVPKEHKDWKYPPPDTVDETILTKVCSR